MTQAEIWKTIVENARRTAQREPVLAGYLAMTITQHTDLLMAAASYLAGKLENSYLSAGELQAIVFEAFEQSGELRSCFVEDLLGFVSRDPAAKGPLNVFLNYKGFHALESYRVAHYYWTKGRTELAQLLQSQISEKYGVDIHPAARIGEGAFIDHATGVVIGETAVIGRQVSILQGVTLGGTGKESGDRHPKIGDGVLIGAGAKVLGNIRIGTGSKVGAGSVVLQDVPDHVTVVGVPARVVGKPKEEAPSLEMNQNIEGA
jgi:serine O-acetyltransferase